MKDKKMRQKTLLCISIMVSLIIPPKLICASCGKDPGSEGRFSPMPHDSSPQMKQILPIQAGQTTLQIRDVFLKNGTEYSRIVESSDADAPWRVVGAAQPAEKMSQVVQTATKNSSVIYRKQGKLYARSKDMGNHWEIPRYSLPSLNHGISPSEISINLAAILPSNSDVIFASFWITENSSRTHWLPGMYVSEDAGDSWIPFSSELIPGSVLVISPSNPAIRIGVAANGPVITRDGGKTWQPVGEQSALMAPAYSVDEAEVNRAARELGVTPEQVRNRALAYAGNEILGFSFHSLDPSFILMISNKGLYQSVNGGNSWKWLPVGSHRLGYVNSAQYDPTDTKTIFVGTDNHVVKSSDAGCTFSIIYPSAQRGAPSKAGRH